MQTLIKYIENIFSHFIHIILFGVMLYFYYKSKDKNILVSAIVLFIHLQIILLGLLYTYYYEIKNNSKVDNYHFNKKGGNVGLFFICMFLILTCLFMYIKSMSYIIYMLVTYIILYVYITSYINYIV